MATKIKGITIKLDADSSGIEKALKDINKDLSSTQKQLSSVNKSLKLDPSNAELMEQKQRMLAKAVEQTTDKLNALKKAQGSIDTSSGSGQEQYDALTREISDTQKSLSALTKEQTAFNQEVARSQSSTSAFTQSLTKVGNVAGQVAEKTKALSMAAAGALAGLAALGIKGAEQADDWLTLSQQIGISTDTLQKWQYAADAVDVDFETLTSAVNSMKRHLNDTSGIWERIGVKVKDSKGEYRDIEAIFNDTVRALGRIDNETQRDIESMAIFGKNASSLAGILDDGGAKLKRLGDEADRLGVIMPEENVERLAEINEQFDLMKAQIKAALVDLAYPIMEALAPIITVVANAVKKLATVLSNINPTLMSILMVILLVIAAVSPIAGIISKICGSIVTLTTLAPQAALALSQVAAAAAPLLPYVALFAAIAVAIGLVVNAANNLVNEWTELRASSDSTVDAISRIFTEGRGDILNYASVVVGALNPVSGILLNMAGGVVSGMNVIKDALAKISTVFQNFTSKAAKFGSDIINAFANGIKSAINGVISAVQKLINTMSNLWSSAERDASNAGSRTANAYVNSYNNTSSLARLNTPTVSSTSSSLYSSSYNSDRALTSAINSLAMSLNSQSSGPTTVNVELVGSAKNIFDTVRVQNNKMTTATGYHALA